MNTFFSNKLFLNDGKVASSSRREMRFSAGRGQQHAVEPACFDLMEFNNFSRSKPPQKSNEFYTVRNYKDWKRLHSLMKKAFV